MKKQTRGSKRLRSYYVGDKIDLSGSEHESLTFLGVCELLEQNVSIPEHIEVLEKKIKRLKKEIATTGSGE